MALRCHDLSTTVIGIEDLLQIPLCTIGCDVVWVFSMDDIVGE